MKQCRKFSFTNTWQSIGVTCAIKIDNIVQTAWLTKITSKTENTGICAFNKTLANSYQNTVIPYSQKHMHRNIVTSHLEQAQFTPQNVL